jgi:8-oxo-dGTP diphosphatase
VSPSGLSHYVFPAANLPIVSAAQLPPYYAISPDVNSVAVLLEWADMQLAKGLRLLLLRAPQLSAKKYVEVAKNILEKCTILRAELMLHGAMDVWQQLPDAHGFHLSAQQLKLLTSRPVENHLWLAASVHNQQELAQAAQVGVDFVTLSPVQKTLSHPDAKPLGWDVFTVLTRQATVPVYALGGLTISDLEKARQSGAQGVAAIRGL